MKLNACVVLPFVAVIKNHPTNLSGPRFQKCPIYNLYLLSLINSTQIVGFFFLPPPLRMKDQKMLQLVY